MSRDTTDYRVYPDVQIEERIQFFDKMFLGVQDFIDQQRHRVDRLRRALDFLTVPGIVTGLQLSSNSPGFLVVGPGTAFDRHGRQLAVVAELPNIAIPQQWWGKEVDVSIFYQESDERVIGGSANEQGARGATRVRERVGVEFHPRGSRPSNDAGIVLGTAVVAEDGTCSLLQIDFARVRSGLHFPGSAEEVNLRVRAPNQPEMLTIGGSLTIGNSLGIGVEAPESNLDVAGRTRFDILHIRSHSILVKGTADRFYPVVFTNPGGASGMFGLEISRPNANVDGQGAGSMLLNCQGHVGKNGVTTLSFELHQSHRFIADIQTRQIENGAVIIWLRGGRHYLWRASHHMSLGPIGGDSGMKLGNENLTTRGDLVATYDRDHVRVMPPWQRLTALSRVTVNGTGNYSGRLNRLDVRETQVATVRAQELRIGHSSQLGKDAPAISDQKSALVVNKEEAWGQVEISSGYSHLQGRLTVAGSFVASRVNRSQVSIAGESSHLALARGISENGGSRLFLELLQQDTNPPKVPEVRQLIRFSHAYRYTHFIEAYGVGLRLRSHEHKNYVSLTVRDLHVNGAFEGTQKATLGSLAGQSSDLGGNVTATLNLQVDNKVTGKRLDVVRTSHQAILRRSGDETQGGVKRFIHLYQGDTNKKRVPEVRLNLRFHHQHRFWHAIESSGGGLSLRTGDLNQSGLVAAHTGSISINGSLTMSDQPDVNLRCADFKIGHKSRRGSPGRAIVDDSSKLWLNFSSDWEQTVLNGSGVYTPKTTYVGGKPAIAGMSESGLRLVRGTVKADGGIECGTGFSISKEGHKWKVSFSPAFSVLPSVVVVQQYPNNNTSKDGGNTRDNAVVVAVNKSWAYIKTGDGDGDHSWRRFHFLAAGR